MDLDRFIATRQGAWRRLEDRLRFAERTGLDAMPAPELRDLGLLYRQACSDLVYARTVLQNDELGDFLNKLVGEAYGVIYRKARFTARAAWVFITDGFPAAVRRNIVAIAAGWAVLLAGSAAGFFGTLADHEAFMFIVPSSYHGLYGNRPENLREQRFGHIDPDRAAEFSSRIYVNNIRVSLLAFAAGASFGFLTVVVLLYNGALLGSIAANFHRWDMNLDFWSLILPHGAIELSCIAIAGAAGLILGGALIRPGRRRRGEAFADAAREAIPLALGTVPFLILAGMIEGFVTPMESLGPRAKLAVGVVTGVAFWIYLLLPRRKHA